MLLFDVVWCNYTLFYQRRSNAFWCLTSFTSSWRGYVLLVSLGSPFEGQSGWPQLGRRWRSIQLSSTWPVDLKDYGLAIVFLVRSGPLSFSALLVVQTGGSGRDCTWAEKPGVWTQRCPAAAGKVHCLQRSLSETEHVLPNATPLRTSIAPATHLTFRWSLEVLH